MKHYNGVLFFHLDCTLKLPKVTCFGTEQKFANGTCYSNHVFKGIWNEAIFKNVTGRRRVSPTEEYWKYVFQNSKYQWKLKYLLWNINWYISWQNVSNFIFYVHVKYVYTLYHSWSSCVISLPLKGQEYGFKIQKNNEKKQLNIPKVFFRRSNKFLSISSGIDDLGEPKYELALGLLFAWILCFLCLLKGIKTTGKVMGSWFLI